MAITRKYIVLYGGPSSLTMYYSSGCSRLPLNRTQAEQAAQKCLGEGNGRVFIAEVKEEARLIAPLTFLEWNDVQ